MLHLTKLGDYLELVWCIAVHSCDVGRAKLPPENKGLRQQ